MQRLRLFSICSNSSQRNSIFILYNKGAVREEQKNILPRCHAGNENRASPAETGRRGPFKKHCPLLMRGNSQGGGQTTNHLLTAANVWEFSYTASAAFSSFPRRWLFLFGYGSNLSVSLRSPASGLRLPASASCKVLHSRPAGRCPNNSSLFPPLAAVVVVAVAGWVESRGREGGVGTPLPASGPAERSSPLLASSNFPRAAPHSHPFFICSACSFPCST